MSATSHNNENHTEAGDLSWIPDAVTCSICTQVHVSPRVFPECGHSVCQPCAIEMDKQTESQNAHTAPVFKCPFCRSTTIRPWYTRVINVDLEKLARHHPMYDQRKKDMPDPIMDVERVEPDLDLPDMCRIARLRMAMRAYEEILPTIVTAAKEGKSYVIIKDQNILHDAELTLDLLSVLLFKHGVYKIQINPSYKEFTIMITRRAFSLTTQYVNASYEDGSMTSPGSGGASAAGTTVEDDILDPLLDGSTSSDTFSRIMGRLRTTNLRGSSNTFLGPLPSLHPRAER